MLAELLNNNSIIRQLVMFLATAVEGGIIIPTLPKSSDSKNSMLRIINKMISFFYIL